MTLLIIEHAPQTEPLPVSFFNFLVINIYRKYIFYNFTTQPICTSHDTINFPIGYNAKGGA